MVFIDINDSNIFFEYGELKLYFSSDLYYEKFKKDYKRFIKDETIKFQLKYKCFINCDYLLILLLYKKIEKRGFKVFYNNEVIKEDYYFTNELNGLSFER